MNIVDFFDVYDREHLQAFQSLKNTGTWPLGFLPNEIEIFSPNWQILLMAKMSEAWIAEHLSS